MVLVDTTVWIDLFKNAVTSQVTKFGILIEENEDIVINGVVLTEVLQGIGNEKEFESVKSVLDKLIYISISKDTHTFAAQIYRFCRKKGLTIRKPIDCIIAATCIEQSIFLLHNDRDFTNISKYFPLRFM